MDTALVKDELDGFGLDEQERALLYNTEVLRVSVRRAGEMAGVPNPNAVLARAHVLTAREKMRQVLIERVNITREDVVRGLKDAVDQAVILADPMAQIAGWREIAKILGYDKTPNVNLHIQGNLDQIRHQLRGLSTADLLREAGQTDVIDADFYKVSNESA